MATYFAIESAYGMQLHRADDLDQAMALARQSSCILRDAVHVIERTAEEFLPPAIMSPAPCPYNVGTVLAPVRQHGIAFRGEYVRIESA